MRSGYEKQAASIIETATEFARGQGVMALLISPRSGNRATSRSSCFLSTLCRRIRLSVYTIGYPGSR